MFAAGMGPVADAAFSIVDDADLDSDRREDLQLARDALGRHASGSRRPSTSRRAHRRLHDRRALGRDARLAARRPPADRQLLRRRAHALRADRRHALRDLRRPLLLVAEDDRASARRAPGPPELLDDVRSASTSRSSRSTSSARSACRGGSTRTPRTRGGRCWNFVSTVGAFILAVGVALFIVNALREPAPRRPRARRSMGRTHARVADVVTAARARLRRDPARLQPRHASGARSTATATAASPCRCRRCRSRTASTCRRRRIWPIVAAVGILAAAVGALTHLALVAGGRRS